MAGLNVEVRNLDKLQQKLAELPGQISRGSEHAVAGETESLAEAMRAGAPVDTGELVASIHTDVSGGQGRVVADAGHALAVEFGTSTNPAQPYAQPAIEEARVSFPQRVRDDVRSELPT